jgi:hypothetical protein
VRRRRPRRRYVPLSLSPFFDFDRSGTPPPPCTRRHACVNPRARVFAESEREGEGEGRERREREERGGRGKREERREGKGRERKESGGRERERRERRERECIESITVHRTTIKFMYESSHALLAHCCLLRQIARW